MALRLIAAAKTDVGKQREQNEDNFAEKIEKDRQATGLFIVADGMGGYHAGEVASKIAVDTVREQLEPVLGPASAQPTVPLNRSRGRGKAAKTTRKLPETRAEEGERDPYVTMNLSTVADPLTTVRLDESVAIDHYSNKLREAIELSSRKIVEYGDENKEARGLGSTITAALVIEGHAFIANVGDSRTYLLRNGVLRRITSDHSLVERLVQSRQLKPEDVYDHPSRNLVYRSLGAGRAEVEVDIFTERLQVGDVLLLCCDGLWEMVRDPQITKILTEVEDPAKAVSILVDRANDNGGEDNITAVVVRCVAN